MFDIGLIEVALILLVALFAIGPERMPEVARFLVRISKFLKKISAEVSSLWDSIDIDDPASEPKEKHTAKTNKKDGDDA